MTSEITVLLVDDHKIIRDGLRKIISDQKDMMVTGEADDGKEAIQLARETSPDIILMDVSMPGMDGIEATRIITSEMPGVRIIAVSLHDEKRIIQEMKNAGASDYVTKMEASANLVATIRSVIACNKKLSINF